MATFNAKFISDANFKASMQDNQNMKAGFGEVQQVQTGNYEKLSNKPQINGVELLGNKTSAEIKVQDPMDALTIQEIEKILYLD